MSLRQGDRAPFHDETRHLKIRIPCVEFAAGRVPDAGIKCPSSNCSLSVPSIDGTLFSQLLPRLYVQRAVTTLRHKRYKVLQRMLSPPMHPYLDERGCATIVKALR